MEKLTKRDISNIMELINNRIKEIKESDAAYFRGEIAYWRDVKKKLKSLKY